MAFRENTEMQQSSIGPTAQQVAEAIMAASSIRDLLKKNNDWRSQKASELATSIEYALMAKPVKC